MKFKKDTKNLSTDTEWIELKTFKTPPGTNTIVDLNEVVCRVLRVVEVNNGNGSVIDDTTTYNFTLIEPNSWEKIEYRYDAQGRRVQKIVDEGQGHWYLFDGYQIIEERTYKRSSASSLRRQIVFGTSTNEPVYIYNNATDKRYYLLKDDQNSVVALYNEADAGGATPRERYEYSAYGRTNLLDGNGTIKKFDHDKKAPTPDIPLIQSDFYNPFGFQGMWRDEHTGLYHTHYRIYNPSHARWLTPDPKGYVDGQNLYRFYGGPNGVDPLGNIVTKLLSFAALTAAKKTFKAAIARKIKEQIKTRIKEKMKQFAKKKLGDQAQHILDAADTIIVAFDKDASPAELGWQIASWVPIVGAGVTIGRFNFARDMANKRLKHLLRKLKKLENKVKLPKKSKFKINIKRNKNNNGLLLLAGKSKDRKWRTILLDIVQKTGNVQKHHLFSNKIVNALVEAKILTKEKAKEFRKKESLIYNSRPGMHNGYENWHRHYDKQIEDYIEENAVKLKSGNLNGLFYEIHNYYQKVGGAKDPDGIMDPWDRIPGVNLKGYIVNE